MNLPPELILQWESGERQPKGLDLRLLMLVKAKGLGFFD